MLLDSLNLGGYGPFVWPAFIFTFITFIVLYIKTREQFIKQQMLYLSEFEQSKAKAIETISTEKKVFSGNPIF